MKSNVFNNGAVTINSDNSLHTDFFSFLSEFVAGNIDADDFSNLLDMHIELSADA